MIMEEFLKTYFKYYLQTLPKTKKLFFWSMHGATFNSSGFIEHNLVTGEVANIPVALTAIYKFVLRDVNKLMILMLLWTS